MSAQVYLWLHHVTFVLHATCAAFVYGATGWLAVRGAFGLLRRIHADQPAARIDDRLRDVLPFVLGLAITFGVGPLLFVQLLAGHGFYTAGILLSHRFMALLPALILGFYLLYVQKTDWRLATTPLGRFAVPLLAVLCFGYTAAHWSELHLLAQHPARWPEVYAAGPLSARDGDVPPRLLVFTGVALQSTALFGSAGLWAVGDTASRPLRQLGALGAVGALLVLPGLALHGAAPVAPPLGVTVPVLVAVLGALLAWSGRALRPVPWTLVVAGVLVVAEIERLTALRRWFRLAVTGAETDVGAATDQGVVAFAAAAALTVVAIGWALRRVRNDLRASRGT